MLFANLKSGHQFCTLLTKGRWDIFLKTKHSYIVSSNTAWIVACMENTTTPSPFMELAVYTWHYYAMHTFTETGWQWLSITAHNCFDNFIPWNRKIGFWFLRAVKPCKIYNFGLSHMWYLRPQFVDYLVSHQLPSCTCIFLSMISIINLTAFREVCPVMCFTSKIWDYSSIVL